jgi:hypothetical protein
MLKALEVSLQVEQIPPALLKIISAEGSSSPAQKLTEQLQLGQLLKGQVIQVLSEGTKALLNIEGQRIVVQGDPSFKNGQSISVRVEQVSPGPVLRILSESGRPSGIELKQDTTIQISSGKNSPISYFSKHGLDFLKISEGETYPAQIKRVVDSENAIVRLNNRNFFVQTQASSSLKPGDSIAVVAEKTTNGLFHFLQSNQPIARQVDAGMIKPYLSSSQPFGEMITKLSNLAGELASRADPANLDSGKLAQLKQTLQLLNPGSGKSPGAQLIKEQVDASGINYEAKVKQAVEPGTHPGKSIDLTRDLKGQLLDVLQKLEDQANQAKGFSSTQLQALKEQSQVFRQAVDSIELNQLTNQLARQENQSILLQIPNPYGQEDQTIKLFVRPPGDEESKKKGAAKEAYNLAFFLDLTKLGAVRVDSQISKTQLSIKIQVENQSVARFIDTKLETLNSRLSELGFDASISCCVEEKIDTDIGNELPEILLRDKSRLVDLTT